MLWLKLETTPKQTRNHRKEEEEEEEQERLVKLEGAHGGLFTQIVLCPFGKRSEKETTDRKIGKVVHNRSKKGGTLLISAGRSHLEIGNRERKKKAFQNSPVRSTLCITNTSN